MSDIRMSDKLNYAVLILSDLHFGSGLLREAEVPNLQLPWWNIYGSDIRRYIGTRCKSHRLDIVLSLPMYLNKVFSRLREQGYRRDYFDRKFDLYVLLGDLATYANGASY